MAMNIDLKNINVSDIKDQLTKLLADKKMVTKIGIIAGAIILFLIISSAEKISSEPISYWFFIPPGKGKLLSFKISWLGSSSLKSCVLISFLFFWLNAWKFGLDIGIYDFFSN